MHSAGLSGGAGTTASGYTEAVSDGASGANNGANSGATAGDAMAGVAAGGAASMAPRNDESGILRGVVQWIEPVPKEDVDIGVIGAVGAAAAGGTVPGVNAQAAYRVTLRTEDGSIQSVVVGMPSDYKVGDKVIYSNGSIQRR